MTKPPGTQESAMRNHIRPENVAIARIRKRITRVEKERNEILLVSEGNE